MAPPIEPLEYAEASEDNPLLPSTPTAVSVASSRPAPTSPRRESIRQSSGSWGACVTGCCAILVVLAINGIYAMLVYGVVRSNSTPIPRGFCSQDLPGYNACGAFMPIFGFITAFLDVSIAFGCASIIPHDSWPDWVLGCGLIIGWVLAVGSGIMIVATGWVATAVVSKSTYAHACDSDWLEISMTAHTWKTAARRNIATFSLVETGELLWTWTSNDPFQNDFNLVGLNSTNPSVMPSLGNVTINHATNELERAWCYGTTNQCATGYVWPFDGLSFEVQFNGTLTRMRNRYTEWSFANVPAVIMHRVDENGQLAERLMQTSIQNPTACKQIKVCVAHAMRRREGVVDPDVLVAAYWLLHKQAVSSRKCTAARGKKKAT